jgi:hypothetical protein
VDELRFEWGRYFEIAGDEAFEAGGLKTWRFYEYLVHFGDGRTAIWVKTAQRERGKVLADLPGYGDAI